MGNLGTEDNPLRVAIVGSGPSGFYATEALLKAGLRVRIDLLERLPVPYGLVRSGVAPDHPKLKQVIEVYSRIAECPDFNYIGNVAVGRDISIAELCASHHAVILTCGAESDRNLGIPGEAIPGSHTATEFVGWYNGHPDYRDRSFDLSHETAVVIGQGNVAADVARILAKTEQELAHTDIAEHALSHMAASKVRTIYVIGRRGPAQAKFTSKELREFGELEHCDAVVDEQELELNDASRAELEDKSNPGARKIYDQFREFAVQRIAGKPRRVIFTFLKSPVEILGNGRVSRIRLETNTLAGEAFKQSARGTGKTMEIEAGIVFRSIGYKGVAIAGVPFDARNGVVPNVDGRVTNGRETIPQLYAAGWIKRGPTGIIGTNRADSVATVNSLLNDLSTLGSDAAKRGTEAIYECLRRKGVRFVTFSDWKVLDKREIERGQPKGKPREKFTRVHEMLAQLDS